MEEAIIPVLAAALGGAVTIGMGVKLIVDSGVFSRARGVGDILDLRVNGKDFTVDLKTIANGGSKKISNALRELERCD